jgi:hypothetical protein
VILVKFSENLLIYLITYSSKRLPGLGTNAISKLKKEWQSFIRSTYFSIRSGGC